MQAIDAGRLVSAWEQGQSQHPLHRALTLLRVAEPGQTIDTLASLAIGERDRRLLRLRQRLFGSHFEAVATCPRCAEKLEMSFSAAQLPAQEPPPRAIEMAVEGRSITVRMPNTADLLEVAAEAPERRARALLERCAGGEEAVDAAEVIQSRMAEADPMVRVELELSCPACEHRWTSVFDIASFLWTEVRDYALRLLRETHTLARAYGWSEADILGMTPQRRQIYLDLVMGG
jgi:hypothetical protein